MTPVDGRSVLSNRMDFSVEGFHVEATNEMATRGTDRRGTGMTAHAATISEGSWSSGHIACVGSTRDGYDERFREFFPKASRKHGEFRMICAGSERDSYRLALVDESPAMFSSGTDGGRGILLTPAGKRYDIEIPPKSMMVKYITHAIVRSDDKPLAVVEISTPAHLGMVSGLDRQSRRDIGVAAALLLSMLDPRTAD